MKFFRIALVLLGAALAAPLRAEEKAQKLLVYVGTYTGKSKGIYAFELEGGSGALKPLGLAAAVANPSFLAIHPNRRFVYAVGELDRFQGKKGGAVSAFAIDPKTFKLTLLNQQSSGGDGPCYLIVDRTGKNVLVANYGGGSVAVLPLQEDGRLRPASTFIQHKGSSVDKGRQEAAHAHSINVDVANRFAFAADLGLDKVLIYKFAADKGTLVPNDPPSASVAPGSGPRHFAFTPDGSHAYVINEMKSTVTAFTYDRDSGTLKTIQTVSTLPEGFQGNNSTAEVQVHPSGKFVYGSNRGHNSIAVFAADAHTGKLTPLGHQSSGGQTPRNFGIDPTGRYLLAANQDSGTIVVFRIDLRTGKLTPTGHKAEVPMAVCVKFVTVVAP